ncbi:MAG: potassium transporter TrkG, partial [Acidimicrobiales bacterium]
SLRSSTELRVYLAVMVAATVLIAGWVGTDHSATEAVRTSAIAVTSAMSTTGITTYPWWSFEAGAQALLLVLVGIGAMSGSAGGGFQYRRLLQAIQFSRRELRRQLHPSEVAVVRVNDRAIDERALEYTTGFIVVFVLASVVGGMLIELGDSSISPSAAISLSISALSTTGAQVLEPVDLASLGPITKISLSGLMLVGRLFIYAVILTAFNMVVRLRQHTQSTLRDIRRD